MIGYDQLFGFTKDDEKQKLDQAFALAARVYKDPGFWSGVSKSTFNGKPGFANTDDTVKQVMVKITRADLEISVTLYDLPWYKGFSSECARELDNGIGIRRSYFESASIAQLVDTIFHESMHHPLGYIHDFWATAQRPFSVPYRIGQVAYETALRILRDDQVTNILNSRRSPAPATP